MPTMEELGKAAYNLHIFKCVAEGKQAPPAWETLPDGERLRWRERGMERAGFSSKRPNQ